MLRGQCAGGCLTRNDGGKPCKVIILYSIFVLSIVFFFSFFSFVCFKGEAAFPGAGLCQRQLDRMVNDIEHVIFPGKAGFDLCRVGISSSKMPPGNLPCMVVPLKAISMPAMMVRLRT